MSEYDAINRTETVPATVQSLVDDFGALGIVDGSVLIVHASLSSLGWVCGGAVTVIEALKIAVGRLGTIVMPTHSTDVSDPSGWRDPAVPREWWPIIRDAMPAFDPRVTPTRGMGAIVECFRTQPNVLRSEHPHVSFAAHGAHATEVVSKHPLEDGLGEGSPLRRLYDLDSAVLLIGVGHNRNTSLHLSEIRAFRDDVPRTKTGAPVLIEGKRQWVEFMEFEHDESIFPRLGQSFQDDLGLVQTGRIAHAQSMVMSQRALVDFGTQWLAVDRAGEPPDSSREPQRRVRRV
jgi:aminoglycoside 3-N-acetyltransferase